MIDNNGAYIFTQGSDEYKSRIITTCQVGKPTTVTDKTQYRTYRFMWDTGATMTMISPKIAEELNLKARDKMPVIHGGGGGIMDVYRASIVLPNGFQIPKMLVGTLFCTEEYDGIIGMDIISHGDFCISGKLNRRTFSFSIPSTLTIDLKGFE